MLCDQLTPESGINCRNPDGPFAWRQGKVVYEVHSGVPELSRG